MFFSLLTPMEKRWDSFRMGDEFNGPQTQCAPLINQIFLSRRSRRFRRKNRLITIEAFLAGALGRTARAARGEKRFRGSATHSN